MAKRLFDVVLSAMGLLVLSPLFLVVSVLIKAGSRGPVFFRQARVGRDGVIFKLYKFRSMRQDADRVGPQITVGKDRRITGVGRVLRRFKMDELPQLLNVLWGDMSIVGPRPEVPRYVRLYTEEQKRVLSVRPGITDPASILYRNEADLLAGREDWERFYVEELMPRKLNLNLEYLRHRSLSTDLKLMLWTLMKIPVRSPFGTREWTTDDGR